MTANSFWECKCSHDKPFIHPLSQDDCMLCRATRDDQPRSSEENVDKFGVVPDLSSKLFVYCERYRESGLTPFVEFANPDWNTYWKGWEDSRFHAFRAADVATQMNKSLSKERMDYRVVRCLNQARIPTEWNRADKMAKYEDSNETGEPMVKTYQPIAKIGPFIDIDPQVLLEWLPVASPKS